MDLLPFVPNGVRDKDPNPEVQRTANGDPTFTTSGAACVDFFYGVMEGTAKSDIENLAQKAWAESPSDTLKLMMYLLDVRQGKSCNKEAIYSFLWLYKEHPKTCKNLIPLIPQFGSWKDLPELLFQWQLAEVNQEDRYVGLCQQNQRFFGGLNKRTYPKHGLTRRRNTSIIDKSVSTESSGQTQFKDFYASLPSPCTELKEIVVGLFAEQLRKDQEDQASNSLAAKWMPSAGKAYDKSIKITQEVANRLSGKTGNAALCIFRKRYLVPLRKHLVEVKGCAKEWHKISYPSVPSVCMKRNQAAFQKHDHSRYQQYLTDAIEGKVNICVSALKPHQILQPMIERKICSTDEVQLIEAHWKAFVKGVEAKGTLSKAIAVVDVSGSMTGQPMTVAVSLGMLVSEVTMAPWKDHVITFHDKPRVIKIEGNSMKERVGQVISLPWGANTNFVAVFDRILEKAKSNEIAQDAMPERIFVFSDMHFDVAKCRTDDNSSYHRIQSMYKEAGYELPQIVFWNLSTDSAFGGQPHPVRANEMNTCLLSGFSANMLDLFLEGDIEAAALKGAQKDSKDGFNSMEIMRKALEDERFDCLQVLD